MLSYRDPATRQRRRPRTQSRRGLGGVPQIAPDRRPTAHGVASRHTMWLAITAGYCKRRWGAPHRPEVSRFECVIHGAARRGVEGRGHRRPRRSSAYLTMIWMHLWVHSRPDFLRGIGTASHAQQKGIRGCATHPKKTSKSQTSRTSHSGLSRTGEAE